MSSFLTRTSHQLVTTKSIVYITITLSVIQPVTKKKDMAEGTATTGSYVTYGIYVFYGLTSSSA